MWRLFSVQFFLSSLLFLICKWFSKPHTHILVVYSPMDLFCSLKYWFLCRAMRTKQQRKKKKIQPVYSSAMWHIDTDWLKCLAKKMHGNFTLTRIKYVCHFIRFLSVQVKWESIITTTGKKNGVKRLRPRWMKINRNSWSNSCEPTNYIKTTTYIDIYILNFMAIFHSITWFIRKEKGDEEKMTTEMMTSKHINLAFR